MRFRFSFRPRALPLIGFVLIFAAGLIPNEISQSMLVAAPKGSSAPVLLELTNTLFTRGREIPSVFLKVRTDGIAECQRVKFSGSEASKFKRKKLSETELDEVKAVLDESQLADVEGQYEFTRGVIDSWMEWIITIPRSEHEQHITISFARTSDAKSRPYPEPLAKLGCLVLKIRGEVYGDDTDYYRPACSGTPLLAF